MSIIIIDEYLLLVIKNEQFVYIYWRIYLLATNDWYILFFISSFSYSFSSHFFSFIIIERDIYRQLLTERYIPSYIFHFVITERYIFYWIATQMLSSWREWWDCWTSQLSSCGAQLYCKRGRSGYCGVRYYDGVGWSGCCRARQSVLNLKSEKRGLALKMRVTRFNALQLAMIWSLFTNDRPFSSAWNLGKLPFRYIGEITQYNN